MVSKLDLNQNAYLLVLFSIRDSCWKLGDLGTVADGTSKHLNTTRYSRGTACYRAPEILQEPAKYNNKADIWALGCIVHELATKEKAFDSDIATFTRSLLDTLARWPVVFRAPIAPFPIYGRTWTLFNNSYYSLSKSLDTMFDRDPRSRPKASTLVIDLGKLKSGLQNSELSWLGTGILR